MDDFFEDGYLPKEVIKEDIEDIDEKAKGPSMFQTMATIVNKKYWPSEEEINKLNSFMMIRYIANDVHGIQMGVWLDFYNKIPLTAQYRFLRHSLSDKISYIKFPKKERVDNQEELDIIMKFYKVNERLGIRYLTILPQTKIDELVTLYTAHGVIGKVKKGKK